LVQLLGPLAPLRRSVERLAAASHLAFETTIWPTDWLQWAAIVGLGFGPVGLAFYVWDIGVKRGDIQVLGAASYATPLLSTLVLIISGVAAYSHTILAAALLIVAGAVLAAKDLLFKPKRASAVETLS
jgi:drug/metabolite transporter (DMT)-like permease